MAESGTPASAAQRALERVQTASFYRNPDPVEAALAFEHAIKTHLDEPLTMYAFSRIAMLVPQARSAFERLQWSDPADADLATRVLSGPNHPAFPDALSMPIDRPRVLDLLWMEFGVTGSRVPVMRVVSVLDWKDVARARLEAWLTARCDADWSEPPFDAYQRLLARCGFPIDYQKRLVQGPLDIDLHVALLARAGKLKFDALPFTLAEDELIRLSMKSAAVWSLRTFAQSHEIVADICAHEAKRPGGAARAQLGVAVPKMH